MWFVALLACQEPFGTDRHDLVGFRIAAVSVPAAAGGDALRPRVAVITEGHPWSRATVDLAWYWVRTDQDVLDLDPLSVADGFGPEPDLVVPAQRRRLALVARYEGEEQRAFVDVAEPGPALPEVDGFTLEHLDVPLARAEGPELVLEARQQLAGTPATEIAPGDLARLQAHVDGAPDAIVRWTSTAGTWFELDARTADWAAADLWLDGDEIEGEVAPLRSGPVTVLALLVRGDGQTTFRATEVHVGPPADGLWVEGRWLPTDGPIPFQPGQAVRGTLVSDDASPVGLRLTGPRTEDAATVPDRGWGTPALPCLIGRDGPLDPAWYLEQLCGRDGSDGVEVVVLPEAVP